MSSMDREWYVKRTNPEFIDYLSSSSSILPITAQILVNRGIITPDSVKRFLDPDIGDLLRPDLLPGIKRAIQRIRVAVRTGERVLVHGDYDADGVTSTAIMLTTLDRLGIPCDYFIPNRFDHGYGFSKRAIEIAKETGTTLIITVDCGINAFDEIAETKIAGIDVIITDHHEPSIDTNGTTVIPDAHAIINPKLMPVDSQTPLCGAGIALMLSIGLLGIERSLDLFDLAAIGTIADMAPISHDNRIIIKKGLQFINSDKRESLAVLRESASLRNRNISAGLLSYSLIPRINAAGRISDASEVVQLFMSNDRDEAHRIAHALNINNARRQKIEEDVLNEALAMLGGRPREHCIVLHGNGWHEGVIGIVASRIVDIYKKPTFIFSVKGGLAKGSARSIPAFDICEGLSRCADCLITFGGHKQAAGLTLDRGRISEFEQKISSVISGAVGTGDGTTALVIDAEVNLKDINLSLVRELMKIEPFGPANEEPLLATRGLEVVQPRVLRGNHLKMKLRYNAFMLDAIGFNMGDEFKILEGSRAIDAAFIPTINEWNSSRTAQLNLKAIRLSIL